MRQDDVLDLFKKCGALLDGHFLLTSGLHSNRYLQCALVLQHPQHASALGETLARGLVEKTSTPELVVAPALGGILVAHEVARALGVPGIFAERQNGVLALRRGFRVLHGQRCLVVEDVVTTGGSTRETMDVVRKEGGRVLGAGALIDRSGGKIDLGVPRVALAVLDVPTYTPEDCPLCKAGSKPVKPGSR